MKEQLANKLWDIANLIAGFSAVQTMALGFFALNQLNNINKTLPDLLIKHCEQLNVMIGSVIGTIFYIAGIIGCQQLAKSLMTNNEWDNVSHVWLWTTIGRITVVILFGLVTTSVIIYAPFK